MVRKALNEKKVGHLGTLDPAAEGLVVCAVGAKALKVVELYNNLSKAYKADICFGAVSTTYDREGVIEEVPAKPGWSPPDLVTIENMITDRFLGKIEQVPPGHSAVNVGGERAYRKMRQGKGVDLPAREVQIDDCDVLSYDYPDLELYVHCGSGTYIRSLAHDLGQVLGNAAYLKALKRTHVGSWSLEDAHDVDTLAWAHVIPLKEILKDRLAIELTTEQYEDVRHGRNIQLDVKPDTIAWFDGLPVAVLTPVQDGAHARKVL